MPNNDPIMAHYITIDGLTPADFKGFTDNFLVGCQNMPPPPKGKVAFNALETLEGRPVAHHRMDPDTMFVSARSTIVTYYTVPAGDNHTFVVSSRGNADLEKKYAANIGKDVIATLECNYMHFEATERGTNVTHIVCSKPNGSIPDMIVKNMSKNQATAILKIAEALKAKK